MAAADTEARTVKGCCPLDCQDTCSWVAHVDHGRVVRVEGAKEHPFTRGALCAKVNDYERRTYADDRLLSPLMRTGAKGEGTFERVSWQAALDTIADRFGSIIDEFGAEALLPINYLGSMGVVQRRALMRIFHALGTSRFHGSVCGAAGNVLDAEGHPRGFDPEEIADSRFVLLWGANLLSTSHHHWHFVTEARKRHGARIVCIDPICSKTARACDEHVSLRPGSDAVLAAGIAHVMLAEDLADLGFAQSVAVDVDELREQVAPWSPTLVAAVCEIDEDVVIRLARELAAARPAVIRSGIAPQQTAGGESFVRALSALAILGGHWRHRGGGLFIETSPVLNELRAARPDLAPAGTRSLDMARLGEYLVSATLAPPVMGLMIWGHNPAVTHSDASVVRRGLARADLFTVSIEHFLTDTARYADVVLPSTTQLEHFDVVGAWGHHYISLNEQAIPPVGETLSHGEIMRRLAARLGLDDPAFRDTDEEIAAAALPEGVTLESLREQGWLKHGPGRPELAGGPTLRLAAKIVPPPVSPSRDALQLLTPKSHYFLNSTFANMPRQRTAMKEPTLEIHVDDAARRGITDGVTVEIKNERGAVHAVARTTDALHPGVVSLAGKWWGEGSEKTAVANLLSPRQFTPGGQPAYNDTFVYVAATTPE